MPQQEDAPSDDFTIGQLTWRPTSTIPTSAMPDDERQALLADWLAHPGLSAGAAACRPRNPSQQPASITHPVARESAFCFAGGADDRAHQR
jgi:hypothetical protein